MRKLTRRAAVVVAGTVAAAGVGIAFAAWTSSGTGTGQAVSRTSVDSTISPDTDGVSLYPGADESVTVEIDNPNDYPVVVTGIGAGSSDETSGGCAAGTVTSDARSAATGLAQDGSSTTVIAPNGSATYRLDVHMAADPSDACKSQTFSLDLTAELASAAS